MLPTFMDNFLTLEGAVSASPALGPRGLVGRQCAGHLPFNYRWRSTAAVILGDS